MNITVFYQDKPVSQLEHTGDYSRLKIAIPGHSGLMKIRFSVPILDIHGYWHPELRTPTSKIHWTIESKSAGQRNFPYLAFLNSRQINRCSIGLTDIIDDAHFYAKMNQEKCTYELTITVALHPESIDFEMILDERAIPWTEALSDWRKQLALPLPEFPEGAWKPVFCTWYAVHAAVTQDWVEKNAAVAAKLGFGTLIIDDGWCFDVVKRVCPETISSWYEWIGDWNLSTKKFPDFENHRKRVQAMGMKYMLWVAPFLVGEKSRFRKEYPDCFKPEYHEGCYTIDSRKTEGAAAQLEKMKHVIRDYGLDGLKVDFIDYIYPNIEESEGRTVMKFVRDLAKGIREVKKDALIEFRQCYATPGMMAYGTQFRAGDVPFDFIDNFQRISQIRISMGDRIPVHADPVYWHPQESPMNISRHMIASLGGVPMLSMDMLTLSETEKRIIGRWLKFYADHLATFRDGKWSVIHHQSNTAYMTVTGDTESIIILLDPARLNEAVAGASWKVTVLNLSEYDLELPGAETSDGEGNACKPGIIPPGGAGCRG